MRIIFVLFILLTSTSLAFATQVRVRIESQQKYFELIGQNLKVQGEESFYATVSVAQNRKIEVSRHQLKSLWVWKVTKHEANKQKTELIADPFLLVEGIHLNERGRGLPSRLIFSAGKSVHFDVIAEMDLENYLVGVLASEMPLSWPIESLKAQAIAARSYALAVISERKLKPYHLESTILDQVFTHVSDGPDRHPLIQKALQAVHETRGMVLKDKNLKTMKAFYHADCGGKTASAKSVWGYGEKQEGVVDAFCPGNPKANWTLQIKKENLLTALQKKIPDLAGEVASLGLNLIRPTPMDRVEKIQIVTATRQKIIPADEFRSMLGYGELRSTKFKLSQNDTDFIFSGSGFGHGVGLCQWGSRSMAKIGKRYSEILNHYYPNAIIGKLELQKNPTSK